MSYTRGICLYVVEIHTGRRWEPTVGARLTRAGGRVELHDWRRRNPCDRFRLTRYVHQSAIK